MNQQELRVGDNAIIKNKEELIDFYEEMKRNSGGNITNEDLEEWLRRTIKFKGKVIEITELSVHGFCDKKLYYGKHGDKSYSFYGEELIKVNTPARIKRS